MREFFFFNVDTQVDFVESTGALSVPKAEQCRQHWQELTEYAKKNHVTVVSSCDFHEHESVEFSENPDYKSTFPPHCLKGVHGVEFVWETQISEPAHRFSAHEWMPSFTPYYRNIILEKDQFDVFNGNKMSKIVVDALPKTVVVYGVATNFCVHFAVMGLIKRGKKVIVIEEGIREIPAPGEPEKTYSLWRELGVERMNFETFCQKISEITAICQL